MSRTPDIDVDITLLPSSDFKDLVVEMRRLHGDSTTCVEQWAALDRGDCNSFSFWGRARSVLEEVRGLRRRYEIFDTHYG
jgi:hypothetical protein